MDGFWECMDELSKNTTRVVDRTKGSFHPRYPHIVYPLDYGYLEGTTSTDGGGVDIWLGSIPAKQVQGCFVTVDLEKQDCEIKLVIGCNDGELDAISKFHNSGQMRAIYIQRNMKGDL